MKPKDFSLCLSASVVKIVFFHSFSAFPADLPSFLLIRAAAKAMPSAARMRLVSSPRRRKGAAFPQSKRRSRRSALNSRIVIWTSLTIFRPFGR